MKKTLGIATALAVLLAAGCSDDSSGDASATPPPLGFGRATQDDLAHLGLPVYPFANAADSDMVKKMDNGLHSFTLMTTTYQPFSTVDQWYASHLESEFQIRHLGSARDGQSSVYGDAEPDDAPPTLQRTVTIESAKDATGRPIVIVTLHTTSTSSEIPHKDWH